MSEAIDSVIILSQTYLGGRWWQSDTDRCFASMTAKTR